MNEILAHYYSMAIKRTKSIDLKDIDHYLEKKEHIPSYEQYVRERGAFIDQLWLNSWLNTAGSHATYAEKKVYLSEKGFDVVGVKKKLINQLFRTEIRNEEPFDLIGWLDQKFSNQSETWNERYTKARKAYLARIKAQQKRELKRKMIAKLEYYIEQLLNEHYEELYLYVRYLLGSHIAIEFEQKKLVPSP
ncbi:hypothetical protein [Bacillus sp. FJAT-47783]|uniref:hypothetical protein n=1 Tax=Bacillus sp. FJAT-47783 TaxID=2922712 RepID=UPI00325FD11B